MTPRIMPARRFNLISAPMRWSPKRRMRAPATGARSERFRRRKEPTALADAPKETKTTEKPATNVRAEVNRPELLHADPGEHGDVPGNKRQNTGREKRDKPG